MRCVKAFSTALLCGVSISIFVAHASAGELPAEMSPEVLQQWQKVGATQMWMRPAEGATYTLLSRREQRQAGDIPCMYFPCISFGTIADAQAPGRPFAIRSETPELQNRYLTGIAKLKQLKYLHVEGAGISQRQIQEIGRLTSLSHLLLHHIDLGQHKADAVVKIICQPALQSLSLVGIPVTNKSLEDIGKLRRLKYLDVRRTKITAAGIARLKQQRPDLQIQH